MDGFSFSFVKRVAAGCDAGRGPGSKEFHNFHGILGSGALERDGQVVAKTPLS